MDFAPAVVGRPPVEALPQRFGEGCPSHELRRCAVGSSGCRENVDFVLSNCGITDYFSCIVSGDRVTRCKPDPEIYLLAAEGLHLPSAECLVFEDARVGITAARRAGAGRIVALATTLPRHTLATQTEADVVIDDFASITDLNTLLL